MPEHGDTKECGGRPVMGISEIWSSGMAWHCTKCKHRWRFSGTPAESDRCQKLLSYKDKNRTWQQALPGPGWYTRHGNMHGWVKIE